MTKLTKEKILERGWSEDAIDCFLGKPHAINSKGLAQWEKIVVTKIENYLSFKNFTNAKDFFLTQAQILETLDHKKNEGINYVNSLSKELNQHDCLLNNIKDYNTLKPIFHLVKKDFSPQENGSYSLFTDGCFKSIGKESFATCAGWLIDNETKEIVVEFTKVLELNEENKRGMPDFELLGISEGAKLIKLLGIKNVQCYTDSSSEAKTVACALKGIGDSRYNKQQILYEFIVKTFLNTNSSIAWIPREYNTHADELTKIPLNAWRQEHNKNHIEVDYIKEHGYIVNRDKDIYFHSQKINYCEEQQSQFMLLSLYKETASKRKKQVVLLYDRNKDEFNILRDEYCDYSYIDESLPNNIQAIKKSRAEGATAYYMSNAIKELHHLPELTLCASSGILAICKKLTPIHPTFQEEIFELHKAIEDFPGKISMTQLSKPLQKKLHQFLEKEYINCQEPTSKINHKIT